MTKPPKRNSKFSSTPAPPAASVSASVPARTRSDNACRIAGTVAGSSAKGGAEPSACGAPLKRTRCGGGAAPLAMPSALVTVGSMDGTSSGRSSESTTDGATPFAIPGAARAARHQLRQPRRRLDWRVARHRARRCAQPTRAVARRCERRHPRGRARRPAAAAAKNADAFFDFVFCQRLRCVGVEFDSRREKLRPALSPPSQQPLSKGRGALAFPLRFGTPLLLRVRGGGQTARRECARARLFFYYSAIKSHFEAQIEALLPRSIPFRSRRARDSAPVALARTRCWLSLYVPPLGRASWAQAKAWQAACWDQPETPRAVMLARPASTNTVFS